MSTEGDKMKPYYTSYDPANGGDMACFMITKLIEGKMEVIACHMGEDANFMRDVFEGNDKYRRTRATPVVNREELGNMAAHMAEVVGTMRGWGKEETSAYHAANFVL